MHNQTCDNITETVSVTLAREELADRVPSFAEDSASTTLASRGRQRSPKTPPPQNRTVTGHPGVGMHRTLVYDVGDTVSPTLHPETKVGVAQALGMHRTLGHNVFHRTCDNVGATVAPTLSQEELEHNADVPAFTEDTARKTGLSQRTVKEDVQIATRILPEVRDILRSTELADSKRDLLRIARLEPELVAGGQWLTTSETLRCRRRRRRSGGHRRRRRGRCAIGGAIASWDTTFSTDRYNVAVPETVTLSQELVHRHSQKHTPQHRRLR